MTIFGDEELVRCFVEDKLRELVIGLVKSSAGFRFRCPVCGDSRKNRRKLRGNYYSKTITYHCFNESFCNCSGLYIVSKLGGIPYDEVKKEFLEYVRSYSTLSEAEVTGELIPQVSKRRIDSIPNHWTELPEKYQSIIESRKVLKAPYSPKNWKFYYNTKTKRIVIPWYENGKLVYCQERAIYDYQDPKYTFPYDTEKELFNIDLVDEDFPYMFGIEGAFDCIWVKNGIGIGGIDITSVQQSELDKHICDYVYFLDNQNVDESSMKKTIAIAKKDPKAKLFIWPSNIVEKDVNEYIIKHTDNPFNDINFLTKNIYNGAKAILKLQFSL